MQVSGLIAVDGVYRVARQAVERTLGKSPRNCVVFASSGIRLALLLRSKICKGLPIGPLRGPIGSPSRRDRGSLEGVVHKREPALTEQRGSAGKTRPTGASGRPASWLFAKRSAA
jgi:hypothetical protein